MNFTPSQGVCQAHETTCLHGALRVHQVCECVCVGGSGLSVAALQAVTLNAPCRGGVCAHQDRLEQRGGGQEQTPRSELMWLQQPVTPAYKLPSPEVR